MPLLRAEACAWEDTVDGAVTLALDMNCGCVRAEKGVRLLKLYKRLFDPKPRVYSLQAGHTTTAIPDMSQKQKRKLHSSLL